jgi:uncharacterized protein
MNITAFETTVPQFMLTLNALKNILTKAKSWGEPKKVEMETFFQMRLAPDMLTLGKQIQIACDIAKGTVSRLTGVTAPVFEDTEKSFDDYMNRIQKTMGYLEGFKPEQFNGFEAKTAEFPWNPGKYLGGKDLLIQHAIPNIYFHVSMTYAILRSNGVDLGKSDFLGNQNWKTK